MSEGYRPRSGDEHGYRRSSPRRYDDRGHDREGGYHRTRNDAHNPPRDLNYDDDGHNEADDGHYSGRPRDRVRGYSGSYNRDHSRGRSPSGGRYPGNQDSHRSRRQNAPPGKVIVIADVPNQATEQDILYGLDYVTQDHHMSSDQVSRARFEYDPHDRRIALVEFRRREDAEYFVDKYQPSISFPLEHSMGKDSKVLNFDIYFARRDDGEQSHGQRGIESNWYCQHCHADNYPHRDACYKCKVLRTEEEDPYSSYYGVPSGPILTGETDECPQGGTSQYLVVRDLGDAVTEDVLSKGVMKLFIDKTSEPTRSAPNPLNKLKSTAPTNSTAGLGAKPGSLRRVFLVRDRRTGESCRYGFAEFATLEDAMAAMAKYRGYGDKFTIASKIVKVGFIHSGVFVPDDGSTNPDFTFSPVVNPALRLRYWDERVYPSVFDVSIEEPAEKTLTEKKADKDAAGAVDKSTAIPKEFKGFKVRKAKKEQDLAAPKIAMNPEIQRWRQKAVELHGSAQKSGDGRIATNDNVDSVGLDSAPLNEDTTLAETEADGPVSAHWSDQYVSYADWDRMACLLCDWEVPPQESIGDKGYSQYSRDDILISHEVRVHDQYKDADLREKVATKLAALEKEPRTIVRRNPRLKSQPLPTYISYADFDTLRCHLCRRNFKHIEVLWRHEQESELHKRMLADPTNKERAVAELKALGKKQYKMVPDKKSQEQQDQQPQYRDRAKERRQALRQPNKPTPAATAEKRNKEHVKPVVEEVPLVKKSKGAGMLAKMGWTAGEGLGAEGTGRTEAIAVDAYAEGVGLGAEGGKLGDAVEEAARKTRNNPLDFVEKTREKARERFEKLG
ncbi:hypothetical protein QBC37DRAFT_411250 [Rhypophila decipiens]|uniref:RNA-binding protein n=1 Tax=Rhypophila decipiens TaxID=261697 RepID=A0AAN7BFA0_9PEZI|nr:hypothetical protein QBC37DRAFT_411250 [Rhypophila decipiens]